MGKRGEFERASLYLERDTMAGLKVICEDTGLKLNTCIRLILRKYVLERLNMVKVDRIEKI